MNETPDAVALLTPIWRRKWLILAVAVLVGAATYEYYKHKPRVVSATTLLYLASAPEEQAVTEKGAARNSISTTELDNQAAILTSNLVAGAVTKSLRKRHDHVAKVAAKGKLSTKAKEKGDFITLTAQAHSPQAAALLANSVAQAYINRRVANRQRSIRTAIAIARRQLRRIEIQTAPVVTSPSTTSTSGGSTSTTGTSGKSAPSKKGSGSSAAASGAPSATVTLQTATLNTKINQLESQLGVAGVQQLEPAKPRKAQLVAPKPKRNAIFGFILALVLASVTAYALSRFDRRLQSMADIESALQIPVLAALPRVGRPIIRREGRTRAARGLVEPLRRLNTALSLASLNGSEPPIRPRTVLFLSADAREGKSTTVAALALVQREAGQGVVVVDADLRRPTQAALLGVDATKGLSEVLSGALTVDQVTQVVASPEERLSSHSAGVPQGGVATAVQADSLGRLAVIVGGSVAANPPALLAGGAIDGVFDSLRASFDVVLVDTSAMLEFSDAMPLLQSVDAIVVVARSGRLRDISAQRLRQALTAPGTAPVLGVVVNGASRSDISKYGFSKAPHGLRRLSPSAR